MLRSEKAPVIGPRHPSDLLIESKTQTKTTNGSTVIVITETYRKPDGSTYTLDQEQRTDLYHTSSPAEHRRSEYENLPDARNHNGNGYHDNVDEHIDKMQKPPVKIEIDGFRSVPLEPKQKMDYKTAIHELEEACHAPAQHEIIREENKVVENDGVNEILLTKHRKPDNANEDPLLMLTGEEILAIERFRNEVLNSHNSYRRLHNTQPLTLNQSLCEIAQQWAQRLLVKNEFTHSMNTYKNQPLGENIASRWTTDPHARMTGDQVVDHWYEQHKKYEYGKDPTIMEAGHFTQIIWKETQELGVGIASDRAGKYVVVCNYFPSGNKVGKFVENVGRRAI